jgi:hypothetical protein
MWLSDVVFEFDRPNPFSTNATTEFGGGLNGKSGLTEVWVTLKNNLIPFAALVWRQRVKNTSVRNLRSGSATLYAVLPFGNKQNGPCGN